MASSFDSLASTSKQARAQGRVVSAQLTHPVVPARLAYCVLELRLPAQLAPGGHRRKVAAQLPPMSVAQRLPVPTPLTITAREWPLKTPFLTTMPDETQYRAPYIAAVAQPELPAMSTP